jgi:molybdopterin-guanine dinucleotide biosynthesis protein A
MGEDKARLQLEGKALLERVLEVVGPLCQATVVVVAQGQDLGWLPAFPNTRMVPDEHPYRGPLAGLYAGLKASASQYNLVVACDLPFLSGPLLEYLLAQARGYDAVVPMAQGRKQTLHAVYSRDCLEVAETLLGREGTGLKDLLEIVKTQYVTEEAAAVYDPTLRTFFNVNTPEDLAEAERLLEG